MFATWPPILCWITSLSMPLFACYRVLYGYSTSINQTKPLMVIALLSLGLNVIVNSLLVFGTLGFPRLGGLGCAWATLITVAFNLVALLWWMQRASAYRATWPLDRFEAPHWPQIKSLLKLGLPIGITYFAETSAFSLIALLIAEFGSTQMAAHQIALNFTSLVFMVPLSLGLALLTRVGQSLGAGDPVLARYQAWVGVALGLGFAALSATLMALFSRQIASAYTSDAAVIALTAQLLMLAAIFPALGCHPGGGQLRHSRLQGHPHTHGDSPDRVLGVFAAAGLHPGAGAGLGALCAGASPWPHRASGLRWCWD